MFPVDQSRVVKSSVFLVNVSAGHQFVATFLLWEAILYKHRHGQNGLGGLLLLFFVIKQLYSENITEL